MMSPVTHRTDLHLYDPATTITGIRASWLWATLVAGFLVGISSFAMRGTEWANLLGLLAVSMAVTAGTLQALLIRSQSKAEQFDEDMADEG